MEFMGPEYFQALLSPVAQASLTEKLLIVGIVWMTMGRKVSKRFKELTDQTQASIDTSMAQFRQHFDAIEKTLNSAVKEVQGLKETVSKDLKIHAQRIGEIENSVIGLSTRVTKLEPQKGE